MKIFQYKHKNCRLIGFQCVSCGKTTRYAPCEYCGAS